ncbi:MAG: glycosyltransferase [bacterium]|nr:glycosyltransferase [bacterium]
MRVLFFTGRLEYGGAERQLVLLASRLAEKDHAVTVCALFGGGMYWDRLATADVQRVALFPRRGGSPAATAAQLLAAPRRLRRLVAETAPDLVHSVLEIPNLVARLAGVGVPLVWGLRNAGPVGWKVRAADRWCAALSRPVPLVICNSRAGRAAAADRGYRPRDWTVVPNGFDTSAFRPDRAAGADLRRAWLGEAAGPVVGLVGRLDPRKGLDVFLAAVALVRARLPEARFVIVGGGSTMALERLRRQVADLGVADAVVLAGEQSDMVAVYGALDLLVSASTSEGLSNVLGEALACGVPCVATDVGDSALVVDDPARIVPSGDPEALAAAVTRHLTEPPLLPDEGLRTSVQERFGVDAMVAATEVALGGVLSGRKGDAP